MKWMRRIMLLIVLMPILLIMILVLILARDSLDMNNSTIDKPATISPLVESYRETVQEIAKENGMEDYVDLILSVMQVESAGTGNDPMQASESQYNEKFPREPNAIMDPIYSIEVGIKDLKNCLKQAGVKAIDDFENIKVALGSYNFGNGFIEWLRKNYDGKWSLEAATVFSSMMAEKMGWTAYGDPPYANKVLNYYSQYSFICGDGDFIMPLKDYVVTSAFGPRDLDGFHYGLDIAGGYGSYIYAPADAKVHKVSRNCMPDGGFYGNYCPLYDFASGAGNYVQLEVKYKDKILYMIFMHMSDVFVEEGQEIKKGRAIGAQGQSGNSTGSHLHIEIHQGCDSCLSTQTGLIDPSKLLQKKEQSK